MAGTERTVEWARQYCHTTQQNQRTGLSVLTMPTIRELDEMMHYHERALSAMSQIRDVLITQQYPLSERSRNEVSKPPSEIRKDILALRDSDEAQGTGGFAHGDSKIRPVVSAQSLIVS